MIKVCMIVHQYYYRDGRVRRYAESLAGAGTQVDVLCLLDEKQAFAGEREGVRLFPIPVTRSYKHPVSYLFEYVMALIWFTIKLLGLYIKNRYQVIHVHNMPDFLVFAALIPKLLGAKIILDIHDPMPEFYMSKFDAPGGAPVVNILRLQERLSTRFSTAVITANSYFKKNLIRRGVSRERIVVVNNIADTNIFNRQKNLYFRSKPRDSFTLLYPGTIAPRYNLDVAIQAMPLLIPEIPTIRLRIIGHHVDHVDELQALAEQLNVAEFVEFLPAIPIDEVPKEMALADVGIYTAVDGPHMSIATPTKVLEYAIMGLPVVASRLPILEEIFGESALMFFEPGNVMQFSQCVLSLYSNPHMRKQLVQNADDRFVDTHAWQHEWVAYSNLLSTLLDTQNAIPTRTSGRKYHGR